MTDIRKARNELICRLHKSIYGLKHANRKWYSKLDEKEEEWGFKSSHTDPCIYSIVSENDKLLIGVYVDDFIIASLINKNSFIQRKLQNTFESRKTEILT